jgi:hypothetical protein
VVGLVADEGLPAVVATRLVDELPLVLSRQISNQVDWQVHTRCDPLLLDENGLIPMLDLTDEHKAARDWDVLVLLHGRFTGWLGDLLAPTKHILSDDDGIDMHLALTGLRGRLRLLAGMVRGNRPWRLVPHLSPLPPPQLAVASG